MSVMVLSKIFCKNVTWKWLFWGCRKSVRCRENIFEFSSFTVLNFKISLGLAINNLLYHKIEYLLHLTTHNCLLPSQDLVDYFFKTTSWKLRHHKIIYIIIALLLLKLKMQAFYFVAVHVNQKRKTRSVKGISVFATAGIHRISHLNQQKES